MPKEPAEWAVMIAAILVVVALLALSVLVVRDTVRRSGRWGINIKGLGGARCPECGETAAAGAGRAELPRDAVGRVDVQAVQLRDRQVGPGHPEAPAQRGRQMNPTTVSRREMLTRCGVGMGLLGLAPQLGDATAGPAPLNPLAPKPRTSPPG